MKHGIKPYNLKLNDVIVYTAPDGRQVLGVYLAPLPRPDCYQGTDVTLCRIHLATQDLPIAVDTLHVRPLKLVLDNL